MCNIQPIIRDDAWVSIGVAGSTASLVVIPVNLENAHRYTCCEASIHSDICNVKNVQNIYESGDLQFLYTRSNSTITDEMQLHN